MRLTTNQQGFIQIPILIVALIVAVGGGVLFATGVLSPDSSQDQFSASLSDSGTPVPEPQDISQEETKESEEEILEPKKEITETSQPTTDSTPASAPQEQPIDTQPSPEPQLEQQSELQVEATTTPQEQIQAPIEIQEEEPLTLYSVSVSPTRTSATIEWQTNKPTESKIFALSKVFGSISGVSTRHIANITGLSSGTNYSFQIEAIADEQVLWEQGSFSTNPDEYTLLVEPDTISVPASGWHIISFNVSAIKNGRHQEDQSISMVTPDFVQNRTISTIQTSGTDDWYAYFAYFPKTVGTHTIVFSWGETTETVNISAVPYVPVDPKISEVNDFTSLYLSDGDPNWAVGTFKIQGGDEPVQMTRIFLETDIPANKIVLIYAGNKVGEANIEDGVGSLSGNQISSNADFMLQPDVPRQGSHTITVTEIEAYGIQSGLRRNVKGLPITFQYAK